MRELICTERLILRDIVDDDAELLHWLDRDPEVMRWVGGRPAMPIEWHRERIRTVYSSYQSHPWRGVRIVLDRSTNAFLGWVFVRPASESPNATALAWNQDGEEEVGYRFHRESWGRGYATEAATALVNLATADAGTSAIVACVHEHNSASAGVLRKLGLSDERTVTLHGDDHETVVFCRKRSIFTSPTPANTSPPASRG